MLYQRFIQYSFFLCVEARADVFGRHRKLSAAQGVKVTRQAPIEALTRIDLAKFGEP